MTSPDPRIEEALLRHAADLESFVRRHAGSRLLAMETVEDLLQGIHVGVVKAAGEFEYRSEREFLAWLYRVARHHLYDRAAHWTALKRDSGGILRLVEGESGALDPPANATSPSSAAGRREKSEILTRALAVLREKDRHILRLALDGRSIEDLAADLGVAYEAAKRARLRAIERLRKAYRLLAGAP